MGIRDVAREAGASISTVSNALNKPGSVSPELSRRIHAAADALGYVPLHAAQQLRARRSGLIGMSVISIANPYFADIMAGAEAAAADGGLRVLLGNDDDDISKERTHLELFERMQVEGVLLTPFGDIAEPLSLFRRRGTPVVLVDAVDDTGRTSSVSLDDIAGGRLAAEHLIAQGRRRLVFLGARDEVRQVRERLAGARQVVAEHPGVSLEPIRMERTTPELGLRWAGQLAAERPDAWPDGILASNDMLACGLVSGLVTHGVRVPDDIAIVGYDDIPFARLAAVPLTSVSQPAREMGRHAAEILLRHIEGEREPITEVFTPELAVRASTGGGAA